MSANVDLDFNALYARAESRGEIDSLESNLSNFSRLFRTNLQFRELIREKNFPIEKRVESVLSLPGFTPGQTFVELVFAVLSEEYFNQISEIYDRFVRMLDERLNRWPVILSTAVPASAEVLADLKSRVSRLFGKEIILRNEVDASLVGGMVLLLPNGKRYDFSLKKQLSEVKSHIMENA
ncbi:hypothetical protein EBR96_04465 [bacterium]|nr:hypothetical protein [bacterium]